MYIQPGLPQILKLITAWKESVFGVVLARIRENTDQNYSEYEHFSRSACQWSILTKVLKRGHHPEAAHQRCPWEKVFWKYAANL